MKCLIPILSKQEFQEEFINKVLEKSTDIVLLAVIDSKSLAGKFGFAATEIMQANKIMEGIEAGLKTMKVKTETNVEWGDTVQKISHFAGLKKCETIFLKSQPTKQFQELVKEIEDSVEKKISVEVI